MKRTELFEGRSWAVRSKIWLELDGKMVIGAGRLAILEAVDRYGSVIRAAAEVGVSYRRVRGAIREMEAAIGHSLVRTYRGGGEHGGAALTDAAYELMAQFKKHTKGIQEIVNQRFKDAFD